MIRGEHFSSEEMNGLIESGRDPEEIVRGNTHLGTCPACRERLRQLVLIDRELRAQTLPHLDDRFTAGVMTRIERSARASAEHRWIFVGACVLALGVTLMLVGYLVFAGQLTGTGTTPTGALIDKGVRGVGEFVRGGVAWLSFQLRGLVDLSTTGTWLKAAVAGIALLMIDRLLSRRIRLRARSNG